MTYFYRLLRESYAKRKSNARVRLSGFTFVYPHAVELQYGDWLRRLFLSRIKVFEKIAFEGIDERYPIHLLDASIEDDWAQVTQKMLESSRLMKDFGLTASTASVLFFGEAVNKFNASEWDRFLNMTVGQSWYPDEVWVNSMLDDWKSTQLSLISKLDGDVIAKIGAVVQQSVLTGVKASESKETIASIVRSMSDWRAKLIARDQTSKLNSKLTEYRQKDAGLSRYVWSTSMDERVRGNPGGKWSKVKPDHWIMHGKKCVWVDSTKMYENGVVVPRPEGAVLVHPGLDIACRCVAIPDEDEINEILEGGIDV